MSESKVQKQFKHFSFIFATCCNLKIRTPYPIHLSYKFDEVPPKSNLFIYLQRANLIGPSLRKNQTMEASPSGRLYWNFKVSCRWPKGGQHLPKHMG
jgi:hypothetical protein